MTLRTALIPQVPTERLNHIKKQITAIVAQLDGKDIEELLAKFAKETGKTEFDKAYFRDFPSFESLEAFAQKVAAPKAVKVADIKKEELVWVVERIIAADENEAYYMELLEKNVPDPAVSDLIYWPSERGYDKELSAIEIVEIALRYNP